MGSIIVINVNKINELNVLKKCIYRKLMWNFEGIHFKSFSKRNYSLIWKKSSLLLSRDHTPYGRWECSSCKGE